MKKQLLAVLIFLMAPMMSALAVKVNSLYEVSLPVMSQQEDDRVAAAREGLSQVLMKLSDDEDIQKSEVVKTALKKADYYIQEYSYQQPDSSASNYTIHLKFDKNDIRRLLKRASVAYWGEKRPLVLVWLVTADLNDDFQAIGSEQASTLLDVFRAESKKYGLPVIFPMMDMTDISVVSADDIASMNVAALNDAAKRYAPDALLIGKIVDNKQELTSHWLLVKGGKVWEWDLSGANPDALFSSLLNEVRQTLSKKFALKLEKSIQTAFKLQVQNVVHPEDFEKLMGFMKQLLPVMQVELSQVTGDVVDMDVQVQGTMASFQENNLLNKHLTLMTQDNERNQLVYEWKG